MNDQCTFISFRYQFFRLLYKNTEMQKVPNYFIFLYKIIITVLKDGLLKKLNLKLLI